MSQLASSIFSVGVWQVPAKEYAPGGSGDFVSSLLAPILLIPTSNLLTTPH